MKRLLWLLPLLLTLWSAPATHAQAIPPGVVQCLAPGGQWGPCLALYEPIAFQTKTGSTGSTGKTLAVTFSSNTTKGSTLLAACGGSNYASTSWTATITDSQLNNWNQDVLVNQSTTQFAAIFRAQNTGGGTADVVTLTIAGANSANESLACTIYEFAGAVEPKSALDTSTSASNAGSTSPSAGSVTPTGSFEVGITAIAAGATSTPTITVGSDWLGDSGTTTNNCTLAPASGSLTFCAESKALTTTPASITGNGTLSVSNAWAAAVATYSVFRPMTQVTTEIAGQNQKAVPYLPAGCEYDSSPTTITAGQMSPVQCDPNANVQTSPAATADANNAVSACNILSAASNNATNCKNAAGNLYGYELYNTTTTIYYLRLYNTSSSPTCSSATGFIRTIPIIPASASGGSGGQISNQVYPVNFATGISFCITGGSSSTDNTNAATGIFGELRYK